MNTLDIIIVHVFAGAAPTIAAIVTWLLQRKKINEIHVMVNGRLAEALARIVELEVQLEKRAMK